MKKRHSKKGDKSKDRSTIFNILGLIIAPFAISFYILPVFQFSIDFSDFPFLTVFQLDMDFVKLLLFVLIYVSLVVIVIKKQHSKNNKSKNKLTVFNIFGLIFALFVMRSHTLSIGILFDSWFLFSLIMYAPVLVPSYIFSVVITYNAGVAIAKLNHVSKRFAKTFLAFLEVLILQVIIITLNFCIYTKTHEMQDGGRRVYTIGDRMAVGDNYHIVEDNKALSEMMITNLLVSIPAYIGIIQHRSELLPKKRPSKKQTKRIYDDDSDDRDL